MTDSKELLLAILALDSYNRGYGAGIVGLSDLENTQIGTSKIAKRLVDVSDDFSNDARAAGFYAISYNTPYGTVISYRGTDNYSEFNFSNDIISGWATGVGAWRTDQVRLSQEFFDSVNQNTVGALTLTGHSLGGGLAGFVASLYGGEAYIFDNMPFELASASAHFAADTSPLLLAPLPFFESSDHQYSRDTFYSGGEPQDVDRSHISGEYVDGEALDNVRLGQATTVQSLASHSDDIGLIQAHSMALLVTLKYAQITGKIDWQSIGAELWNSSFDDVIAAAAGFSPADTGGAYSEAGKLLATIAYSELEADFQGNGLVFGDTGIRALFDDANELGLLKKDGQVSDFLRQGDVVGSLAEVLVQFAGQLALKEVKQSEDAKAVEGVAEWLKGAPIIDGKGFGSMTTLATAVNDNEIEVGKVA